METNWGAGEFRRAGVPDRRFLVNLGRIAEALLQHHGLAFSTACGPALRQAAHRLFTHKKTTVPQLLQGHVQETAVRAAAACGDQPVLVAHDTTEFNYTGHQQTPGLGYLSGGAGRGLIAHGALALTPTGVPLGVLHLEVWARDFETKGKRAFRVQRATAEKESQKWLTALAAIEKALPASQAVLVLADREADFYDYLAAPRRAQTHLLVRAHQPRKVRVVPANPSAPSALVNETTTVRLTALPEAGEAVATAAVAAPKTKRRTVATAPPEPGRPLPMVLADAPLVGEQAVQVPPRPGQPERQALLVVRCVALEVLVPADYRRRSDTPGKPLRVWAVDAQEVEPPAGATAIHWVLLSTQPLPTPEAAVQALVHYSRRWGIERLHYTLKSGLQVEQFQMDAADTLRHALAVSYVVAWRLLWLTHAARVEPEAPAETVLPPEELRVLALATGQPVSNRREVIRALARLGGFPGNPKAGDPGVKTLWLGLTRFEGLMSGWRLQALAQKCEPR